MPTSARLPSPYRDEAPIVDALLQSLAGRLDWPAVVATAAPWVQAVRDKPAPFWALESLLRVPDAETAIALTADQLGRADFSGDGDDDSPHRLLATLSSSAIVLAKRWLPDVGEPPGLLERLGSRTVVAATVRAIQLLGRQFVLGRDIGEALEEARAQRRDAPTLRFSFDMLGEGARTERDALRYLAAYDGAIRAIAAQAPQGSDATPAQRDGISIKLSALHPRYEDAQRERVMSELVPRLAPLLDLAAAADINLTIDAEESDRLELSLDVFDALAAHVQQHAPRWSGFGLAVQAYQTRVIEVIDEVARIARARRLRVMVRLVKGAYWDGEIKRAQESGFDGYPVFTHKQHTDIAYLAAARALIAHHDVILPQFATHNAGTIAAIVQMAQAHGAACEMQRLHGMGEGVYREVMASLPELNLRVYAPVGEHRDLLAYLVRRLLENGANSSFVHQLSDAGVPVEALLASPLQRLPGTGQSLPRNLYGPARINPHGVDLTCVDQREPLFAAWSQVTVPTVREADAAAVDTAMRRLRAAFPAWNARPVQERAHILELAAVRLEARLPQFCALLVAEGRKTWGDCVSEVREAIDFCRYYALEARTRLAPMPLPGPTGERNELRLHGRGVFVCISPWNFPLAIFAGQVVAALVSGNAVAAKPAEQTPGVAQAFVDLLHEAGVPRDALQLLHGAGELVGAKLVAHPLCAGVCFTGSTQVAKHIQRALAASDGPIQPLIAETGGLNAMVVDSTALPEQVVDAVVQSAFRSAGQRCSALRLLCVHESIATPLIEMLTGAMQELRVAEPHDLATDVGPVIDADAHATLTRHVQRLEDEAELLARCPLEPRFAATHIAPVAFELDAIEALREEVFGPVLHVVRYRDDIDALVERINALGYGLTLGVQTRIDSRALRIADRAAIGNVYVNRNMIGAVVGVQPFGGEGLSGTGPKAGGPHYLYRFCAEQTLTINTAAAGGNASLLAGGA
jgi:RHH-type proline utilization regulon transcriptional repressor/proline dehydrogenase/delta 1-pyrroline-5-carboxylate dehydrogenase